jgi:hypothetical protein
MEIILGKNKSVTITPWKAITKKNFLNILKDKRENISEDDILKTLVHPYIDNTDLYLSSAEIQVILRHLREISIGAEIEFTLECDNCNKEFETISTLNDISTYQPNTYPCDLGNYSWVDIDNKDTLKTAFKKYKREPEKLIELLLHIDKIDGNPIKSFNEVIDYYNNLTLPEEKELMEDFRKVESYFKISSYFRCTHCDVNKEYSFDVIPGFFDPLMPSDI